MKCEATKQEKFGGGRTRTRFCENPGAAKREVAGKIAASTATLCKWHAGVFTRRGYKVTTIETNG